MKRYLTLIIIAAFVPLWSAANLYAQEVEEPSLSENATTEIAPADKEGVFPSIVHKGNILDFLKFMGVASNKNIVPSKNVRGQIEVNLFNVTWKEAIDAVLVSNGYAYEQQGPFLFVYTKKEMEEKIAAARQTVSHVIHLNYVSAGDAEDLIGPLLSEDGEISTTPKVLNSDESGETWAGNNCIIVIDYPEYLENIEATLKAIDKRPPQILVEATIMVANLDDTNELGIDFNVLGGVNFQATDGVVGTAPSGSVSLKGTTTSAETDFSSTLSAGGLSIGIVKSNLGLFIRALESITDVVTLGNPKVLALNRQRGEVRVGRDEGYITTESTATSSNQTVEMLETGTILRFRPFVMDDGYVRMELNPEDSSGEVKIKGTFALPEKTTTQVTTNVLVKDGHTIVIGGLFREKTTLSRSQVPLVGNIPILGQLFKSSTDINTKEEVIFLITPHIIREESSYAAAEEVLEKCNLLLLGAREGMMPLSRERLANAHYNRARELQAEGRLNSALWQASLAVHTSPIFQDALDLRNELQARRIYEGEYSSMRLFMRRLIEKNDK